MNTIDNPYVDRVFSLSEEQFAQLQTDVSLRKNKEKYGVTTFEQLADRYRRSPCVLDAEAMTAHLTVIHQMVSKDTFAMCAVGHSLSFPKPYSIPQTKTLIHGPDTWS